MPKNKTLRELSRQSLRRRLNCKQKLSTYSNEAIKEVLVDQIVGSDEMNGSHATQVLQEQSNESNEDYLDKLGCSEFTEEYLSEMEEEMNDSENPSITDFLLNWAPKHNIKANALNELLYFLKNSIGLIVPLDSRTLLKTPQVREVLECQPGQYVHIGFKANLDHLLVKHQNTSVLELDINIDGVPISKSNQSCFWPVLGRVSNLDQRFIFVVGIYHGFKKPNDFNQYLRPLVNELKSILRDGYLYKENHIPVKIRCFICDAPARSGLLGTKSHTGYFGCLKCTEEGEFVKNRMIFPIEKGSELRTDKSFRQRTQVEHQKYTSILEELPIDMITQFPLDYLHLVCLGVMKKLIQMWLSGDSKSLLSNKEIQKISNNLGILSLTQPNDFQRSIRQLNDFGYFKGSELRVFLLYSGPFVLKDIISTEKYNHFMLLHVGILLLCHNEYSKTKLELADNILKQFVNATCAIYGRHHLTYNLHCLTHLAKDVQSYGNLDNFSAFAFESYMCVIKRLLRKPHQPLAQICNRIFEINNSHILDSNKHKPDSQYPIIQKKYVKDGKTYYSRIVFRKFEIRNDNRNCWVLTESKTIIKFSCVEVVKNEIYIWGKEALNNTDFYNFPIASSKLDIFEATFSESDQPEKRFNYNEITKKLFAQKHSKPETFVFFPILHS